MLNVTLTVMKYRPSRSFLVLMSVFGLFAAAGTWTWWKINSVPSYMWAGGDWWRLLSYKEKPVFNPPTDRKSVV